MRGIYIGFDTTQAAAFAVARHSIRKHSITPIPIHGLVQQKLKKAGLYRRPHDFRNGVIWDILSDAPCSTEFSNTRFLVPKMQDEGWALFMDSDMLVRCDLANVFDIATTKYPDKAVVCVKHQFEPTEGTKMVNQIQTTYSKKNWSSMMLFNCSHPLNKELTLAEINGLPGRDLHGFCWLEGEDDIGELTPEYNYLVGHTKLDEGVEPKIIHYTDGVPILGPEYANCEYSKEWWAEYYEWASR